MFDFNLWCSWTKSQCQQSPVEHVVMTFSLGKTSPKQGATVAFNTDRVLMQLGFWETGEADFYGVRLINGLDISGFNGRLLTDASFERTFRDCLATAASD